MFHVTTVSAASLVLERPMFSTVAARSKAWVCGRSLAGVAGLNAVWDTCEYCFVR